MLRTYAWMPCQRIVFYISLMYEFSHSLAISDISNSFLLRCTAQRAREREHIAATRAH